MKKIAVTMFCTLAIITCTLAQDIASTLKQGSSLQPENAAFNWTATTYDFGKIKKGAPVSHEFTFTNKGKTPLIITSVKASCGCTVTSYSKDPIQMGSPGFVKATYNAASAGQFTKTVSIQANTDDDIVTLTIKGEVVE